MSMNGKTKTLKTGNQDYMNLLYSNSDSDSDDKIPDLKLPPIKGKKQRRRKGGSVRQEEYFCNKWILFKSIFVLLCLISFIILSGLLFWSLHRINDLQQQLSKCLMFQEACYQSICYVGRVYVTFPQCYQSSRRRVRIGRGLFPFILLGLLPLPTKNN